MKRGIRLWSTTGSEYLHVSIVDLVVGENLGRNLRLEGEMIVMSSGDM